MLFHSMQCPAAAKVRLSVPARERIGAAPLLTVAGTGALLFLLSFLRFFHVMRFTLTQGVRLEFEVLDALAAPSIAAALLVAFVVSQVRVRLNHAPLNAWSAVHCAFCAAAILFGALYVIARPEQSLGAIVGATDRVPVTWLLNVRRALRLDVAFERGGAIRGFVLYGVSYAFAMQLLVASAFAAHTCRDFGTLDAVMYVREAPLGSFQVIARGVAPRGIWRGDNSAQELLDSAGIASGAWDARSARSDDPLLASAA